LVELESALGPLAGGVFFWAEREEGWRAVTEWIRDVDRASPSAHPPAGFRPVVAI